MIRPFLMGLTLAVATGSALVAPQATGKPTAQRAGTVKDWSATVVATPEGGFRMGNAAAKVKLVEYGSLTCSHCGHFARDGVPTLIANYVKSGTVSYEYRNYVLNGIDVTATLLARCGGSKHFFGMADALYASQPQWVGKFSGLPAAEKDKLKALPEGARLARIAELGGLIELAGRHGVTPARARACLTDSAALDRLGTMAEAADALGVVGTPTFFLNGQNIGTHTWATLQPVLRRSLGT